MTWVKICGVTKEEDAYESALAGADYIGLIFSPTSPRNLTLEQAKRVARGAKRGGAIPVAVFTDAPKYEMERIAALLEIDHLQLHSPYSIEEGMSLERTLIFVNPLNYTGIHSEKDFILFDSKDGNYGPLFPGQNERWFLAGGLTPQNLRSKLTVFHPPGVDVAGGVESAPGIKDLNKVKEFINIAKNG